MSPLLQKMSYFSYNYITTTNTLPGWYIPACLKFPSEQDQNMHAQDISWFKGIEAK